MLSTKKRKPDMREHAREELDTLKTMLDNWKKGFLGWASPDGDNENVLMEFTEDIRTHLYPYVRRLLEANLLTREEADEFRCYCFCQVDDLRIRLRCADAEESRKEA